MNKRLYQLSHCTYYCRYHLVWTTRYRGKVLVSNHIKQKLKKIFKSIAKWKGFEIHGWHIGDEHIHLHITIPPKFSISYATSIIKGKSSAWIKKDNKKIPKGSFWARGYFISTIGINQIVIERYIESQNEFRIYQPTLEL